MRLTLVRLFDVSINKSVFIYLFIYFISFIYLLSNIKGNSGAAFIAKLKEQFDTLIDFSKRLK